MQQLVELQEIHAELTAAGATVAAISADPAEETRAFFAEEDPEDRVTAFPLLSDAALRVCSAYGVHDPETPELALPAVIIVDRQGVVRWVRVSETVGDRPEAEETLERVRGLGVH